ncbi:MAG: hypothetical protein ACK58L_13485 [Planctomycetota bacterium]
MYGTAQVFADVGAGLLTIAGGIAAYRAIASLSVTFATPTFGWILGSNGTMIWGVTGSTATTITGAQIIKGTFTVFMVGKSGDFLKALQNAQREFRQNRDFKNWFHKVYKEKYKITRGGRSNPDMGAEEILEAFEQWIELGRPTL